MKNSRMKYILLTTLVALLLSCSTVFASHAVVDSWSGSYGHQSRFDNCIIIDGIDISEWQNASEIDYNAVKKHGIDYVFIRVGKTATDIFNSVPDTEFEAHYAAAKEAGLMVGVYYYSTATTVAEAETEAANVISWLDGRDLHLPVVLDYEDCERIDPSKVDMTANALKFMEYIEDHSNYDAMFYSYRALMDISWAGSVFQMQNIDSKYPVWIAQYSQDINSYTRPFEFWQYTDSGNVSGISRPVDCNFWYFDAANYPAASGKTSIANTSAELSCELYAYDGNPKTPSITLTHNGNTLEEGSHYQVSYIKNAKAGDAYVLVKGVGDYDGYKVVKFGVKKSLEDASCTISDIPDQAYTGSVLKPAIKVYYNDELLTKDQDYTVSYRNATKAGTATVTVTGKGIYSGVAVKSFTILPCTHSWNAATCTKAKTCKICDATSGEKLGHKYSSTYTLDKKATTSADGSKSKHCTRSGCSAKTSVTTIPKISKVSLSYTKKNYTGSAIAAPTLTVQDSDDNTISSAYYTVSGLTKKTSVGRYKVTVTFKGNYSGTKTLYFTIVPKAPSSAKATLTSYYGQTTGYDDVKFSWSKATGASGYYVYYKKSTSDSYTYLTRTTNTYIRTKDLTDGVKYYFKVVPYYKSGDTRYKSLSYKTASVYTLKKLAAPKVVTSSGKAKVSWANINGETGYHIVQYQWKNGKYEKLAGYYTTSTSKLFTAAKGKTRYYQVRAYKTVDGTKIFGPWSEVTGFKR